jgi:hypothetical protein
LQIQLFTARRLKGRGTPGFYSTPTVMQRARRSVVIKALCCSWNVAGSRPDEVNEFSQFPNSPSHTRPWFTEPLTEMSTTSRKIMFLRSRARTVRKSENLPPSLSLLCRQCGILNISQHCRPPQPVTWIALLYEDGVCFL